MRDFTCLEIISLACHQHHRTRRHALLAAKRLSWQVIILVSLAVIGNTSPAFAGFVDVTLNDALAYWRLDDVRGEETRRTRANDSAGKFVGTYQPTGVTLGEPGLIPSEPSNTAVRFDGQTGGVNIPGRSGLNYGGPWEEKSILLWFNADNVNTMSEQVLWEEGGTDRGLSIYIRDGQVFVGGINRTRDDGRTSPWINGPDDPRGGIFLSTPISSNQTYQVGLVMDGDQDGKAGTMTGYLNGHPFDQKTGVGRLFEHPAAPSMGSYRHNIHFDNKEVWDDGTGAFFAGVIDELALYNIALPADRITEQYTLAGFGATQLQPGDADMDLDFDQLDLVQVQIAAKYLTGQAATWGDGDWNGAPGGEPGNPPTGDNLFNQFDIIAAQQADIYIQGPYSAIKPGGAKDDGQTSLVYDAGTGELAVDAPSGKELTSINVTSASGQFIGDKPAVLDGAFDNFAADNVFKATFGGSFGSISFGNVLPAGIPEVDLAADLSAVGSLAGGGDLGEVDLVYVPEPTAAVLIICGCLSLTLPRRHR